MNYPLDDQETIARMAQSLDHHAYNLGVDELYKRSVFSPDIDALSSYEGYIPVMVYDNFQCTAARKMPRLFSDDDDCVFLGNSLTIDNRFMMKRSSFDEALVFDADKDTPFPSRIWGHLWGLPLEKVLILDEYYANNVKTERRRVNILACDQPVPYRNGTKPASLEVYLYVYTKEVYNDSDFLYSCSRFTSPFGDLAYRHIPERLKEN